MSYDEHLISMAGGDGEPDLDAIQARRGNDKCAAHDDCLRADVQSLLALVRSQQAQIERVETQLDEWASFKAFPDAEESQRGYSLGKRHAADAIRAALTATEES